MRKDLKIGDSVYIDGYTSMAQNNAGISEIEDVSTRYDELTGEQFTIYKVGDSWFDGRDGSCYSNKNSMYYIDDN